MSPSAMILLAISSTSLNGQYSICGGGNKKDVRLEAQNVGHAMRLIASLGRALAHSVDEVHTGHPLVVGELDLARKVVEVPEEAAEELAIARSDVGTHSVNDMLGELGVKAAGALGTVGLGRGHCECWRWE